MLKTRAMFFFRKEPVPRKTFAAQSSQLLGPAWQVTDKMSVCLLERQPTPHF